MNYPKVSIIILNWNGLRDTIECLESLKKVTYSNYDIIIVDNGSKGNDAEVLEEKYGNWIYIIKNEKNLGYAGGCNVGIKHVLEQDTEYVLILNNDVVVENNFLSELIKIAETTPDMGIAGPKVYYYNDPNRLYACGERINYWLLTTKNGNNEIDNDQFNQIEYVDGIVGCAILIKKKVFKTIGMFDEDYFSYGEETDFCIRAKKAGFHIVYVPTAKVWHKDMGSTGGKLNKFVAYYQTRNRIMLIRKTLGKKYWITALSFFLFKTTKQICKNIIRRKPEIAGAMLRGLGYHLKIENR